jgi:hypothetical protein
MDYEGDGKPALSGDDGGTQGEILKRDGKRTSSEFDAIPFAAMTPSLSRIGSSAGPWPIW